LSFFFEPFVPFRGQILFCETNVQLLVFLTRKSVVEADSSALPEGLLDRPFTAGKTARVLITARFSVLFIQGFSRKKVRLAKASVKEAEAP
jgi:hypothetical protein